MAHNDTLNPPTREGKPILCLDFDGVIHSYTSGWKGVDVIPDPPVPGFFAFLAEAWEYFEIHVYSYRSGQKGGIEAMKTWMDEHNPYGDILPSALCQWPTEKPPATISIDDRCLTFTGKWPTIEELQSFKPWNR